MIRDERIKVLKSTQLFLGAFVFGLYLSNIFHEFGHAAAILMQDGLNTGFSFNFFGSSFTYSTYVPNHILLYAVFNIKEAIGLWIDTEKSMEIQFQSQ